MPCEVRMTRNNKSSCWGFRLTGGVTFSMPLTVFEVQEGGRADKAGIRVGDVLLQINGMATNKLALKEANAIIDAGESMDLLVTNLLDQEAAELEEEMKREEKEEAEFLAQKADVSLMDLPPPRPAPKPDTAQRKCWHPVVLDTNPPPIIVESTGDEEAPHKKILRNFRQAMSHKSLDPSPENPPIEKPPPPPPEEDIQQESELSVEEQLRQMQKQLVALCALPAALQKSLTAVSERIYKLLPPEPQPEMEPEIEPTHDLIEDEYEEVTEEESSLRDLTPEPEIISENLDYIEEEPEEEQESEPEPEPEPELTPEEIERIEKLRKMEELNRAWPWGDDIKPVYKISDRYKVPHSEMFNSKIQDMESKMILRKAPEITN